MPPWWTRPERSGTHSRRMTSGPPVLCHSSAGRRCLPGLKNKITLCMLSLCLSLFVFLSVCFCLYISLCVSLCLSLCRSFCLCFCLCLCLCRSLCLSVSIPLCLYPYAVSRSLSISLSVFVCLSLSVCHCLCFSGLAKRTSQIMKGTDVKYPNGA